jgi:hypothetical protein
VALLRFQGNPLFLFSLLLSAASLVWLARLHMEDTSGRTPVAARRRRAGIPEGDRSASPRSAAARRGRPAPRRSRRSSSGRRRR